MENERIETTECGEVCAAAAERAFHAFVEDRSFPCLAGKGSLHRDQCTVGAYGELGTRAAARAMAGALSSFVSATPADGTGLRSFVAVFTGAAPAGELEFENALWRQLQYLHEIDPAGDRWDLTVSADPESAQFSFSFAGRALFVVGMHPASSRLARRFQWPALAFNPRAQFERLRAEGRFERLRTMVRERDVSLQGTINPNLADFGEASEARQYSGRAVEPEWRCPFHHRSE